MLFADIKVLFTHLLKILIYIKTPFTSCMNAVSVLFFSAANHFLRVFFLNFFLSLPILLRSLSFSKCFTQLRILCSLFFIKEHFLSFSFGSPSAISINVLHLCVLFFPSRFISLPCLFFLIPPWRTHESDAHFSC